MLRLLSPDDAMTSLKLDPVPQRSSPLMHMHAILQPITTESKPRPEEGEAALAGHDGVALCAELIVDLPCTRKRL